MYPNLEKRTLKEYLRIIKYNLIFYLRIIKNNDKIYLRIIYINFEYNRLGGIYDF